MQSTALLWHLRQLSDQPIIVSGIGIAQFLPILLFGLYGGVLADSINRRKIMFFTQTTMALTALVLGLLTMTGTVKIWHIYLLTAIHNTAVGFDLPARQALVPNLVPKDVLPSAFSLQSIAFSVGAIIGPALSGLVIGYMGQSYTYLINAVTFIAVLAALVLMGPIKQEVHTVVKGFSASMTSIREGLDFILHQPIILSSMILDFIATFFSSANTLLPFIAQDLLKVGEIEYGWLAAAQSVGGVAVGLLYSQRNTIKKQGKLLMGAVVSFGAATIFLGFSKSLAISILALALIGASDAVSTILRNTIRQIQTPDYIRGRMISINQIFFTGGPQLGEIEAGAAAQLIGIPGAIITGGIGCILGVIFIAVKWPQLRRYDGVEELTLQTAPQT